MSEELIKCDYALPFDIVRQSDILTAADLSALEPLREELKETFLKVQIFRTRTEAETSVLNGDKYTTPAAKYWQSTREQNVHFHELVMLSYEYRKAAIEVKRTQNKIIHEGNVFDKQILQVELERQVFNLRCMERTAKDRIREICMWSDIKAREATRMTVGELADVDNHQLKSYTMRHYNMAKKMGDSGGPADRQNIIGQLKSCVKLCHERGILDDISAMVHPSDWHEILAIGGLNSKQFAAEKVGYKQIAAADRVAVTGK